MALTHESRPPERGRRFRAAHSRGGRLTNYFRGLIDARRAVAGADLLSGMTQVEEAGDRLSTDELVATCVLLFFAGHETTRPKSCAVARPATALVFPATL